MKQLFDPEQRWTKIANDQLLGRKIVRVRYMTPAECQEIGWYLRPIVLELDDGNIVWASADDEGNNGGAIFTMNEAQPVLPVMRG